MKKPTLLILISIILLLSFTLPVFADNLPDPIEIAQYNVAIVEKGTIGVDGLLEDAYLSSTKIVNYDEDPLVNKNFNTDDVNRADARFFAYVVVDTEGMYVYAEIKDGTMLDTPNSEPSLGDYFAIYIDLHPYSEMHLQAGNLVYPIPISEPYLTSSYTWDPHSWRSAPCEEEIRLCGDYNGKFTWYFNLYSGNKTPKYIAGKREDETGWIIEWFVPWLTDDQGNAIARGEQFHCSVGFESGDDSCIDDGKENAVVRRFDQSKALGYWYSSRNAWRSDLIWGERPDPTPETSDTAIAVISALIISGAGVVIFSRKKRS